MGTIEGSHNAPEVQDVTERYDVFNPNCPTRQILELIGGRWTVLIILSLSERTMRFGELRDRLDRISPKVLTKTLRNLEHDGIVTREVFAEVPPRVEYSLTELGHTLQQPLEALRDWAVRHVPEVTAARTAEDGDSLD
jgi:DNA-binding HxlR family transcriptional regulator